MQLFIFIILYFTISFIGYSQSVQLWGEVKQGSLIFGIADKPKNIRLDDEQLQFDEDGYFVFGFDRDDTSSHVLIVEMHSSSYIKKIELGKREYNIQRINRMNQKYISPPEEVLNRIAQERKITTAAKMRVGEIKEAWFRSGFEKPIKSGRISSVFGSQRILNGVPKNAHNGIDIAVPEGTPVKAMSDGKVLLSADNFYYAGNFIILDHGLGINSLYLHLSESLVEENQTVKKGQVIGKVGSTGRSTGPHLHWTVQWFDKRVDPNSVFNYFPD